MQIKHWRPQRQSNTYNFNQLQRATAYLTATDGILDAKFRNNFRAQSFSLQSQEGGCLAPGQSYYLPPLVGCFTLPCLINISGSDLLSESTRSHLPLALVLSCWPCKLTDGGYPPTKLFDSSHQNVFGNGNIRVPTKKTKQDSATQATFQFKSFAGQDLMS